MSIRLLLCCGSAMLCLAASSVAQGRIPAPADAESLWTAAQQCSTISPVEPLDSLKWFVLPADHTQVQITPILRVEQVILSYQQTDTVAIISIADTLLVSTPAEEYRPPDSLFLSAEALQHPRTIEHGLLHYLLHGRFEEGAGAFRYHPFQPFFSPCGLIDVWGREP